MLEHAKKKFQNFFPKKFFFPNFSKISKKICFEKQPNQEFVQIR